MKTNIEILAKSISFNYKLKMYQNNNFTSQSYIYKRSYRPQRIFNSVRKQVKKDNREL